MGWGGGESEAAYGTGDAVARAACAAGCHAGTVPTSRRNPPVQAAACDKLLEAFIGATASPFEVSEVRAARSQQ